MRRKQGKRWGKQLPLFEELKQTAADKIEWFRGVPAGALTPRQFALMRMLEHRQGDRFDVVTGDRGGYSRNYRSWMQEWYERTGDVMDAIAAWKSGALKQKPAYIKQREYLEEAMRLGLVEERLDGSWVDTRVYYFDPKG